MKKQFDCVVCGTCTVDILVKPIELQQPLGIDRLVLVEPITATTGGIVSNSGMALAKLGLRTAALATVGNDDWAEIIRRRLAADRINTTGVVTLERESTSSTIVMINAEGQRSFAHCPGAGGKLDKKTVERHFDLLAASQFVLFGYYSLLPELEYDLPDLFRRLRMENCVVALDSAGAGGSSAPLKSILPHVDIYFPSLNEARQQTGYNQPREMLTAFRSWGAPGIIGVKMGAEGALLSSQPNQFTVVPALIPPRPVVDTTGAGDAFFAGLITGLRRGMTPKQAAKLGAAVGAISVTGFGASGSLPSYEEAERLAFGATSESVASPHC